MKLKNIAEIIGGKLNNGSPDLEITGIARIETAKEGEISWLSHPRCLKYLPTTRASCVIIPEGMNINYCSTIEVKNPLLAISILIEKFYPESIENNGISNLSYIGKDVKIGKNVSIGAFSYIGKNVCLGDNVIIFPNVYIGENVKIGDDTKIYPNATIFNAVIGKRVSVGAGCVIGSDGFGYTNVDGEHKKIAHRGNVIIEDDVEIGALTAIDRSLIGSTIIKKGTKIDNLVHIAHNVEVGENSIIVAQVGIAGSVRLGKNVILGGQVGIRDHVELGDNVIVGGQSGVTKDIAKNTTVIGFPARERIKMNKVYSLLIKLPELFKRVDALEKKCNKQ